MLSLERACEIVRAFAYRHNLPVDAGEYYDTLTQRADAIRRTADDYGVSFETLLDEDRSDCAYWSAEEWEQARW